MTPASSSSVRGGWDTISTRVHEVISKGGFSLDKMQRPVEAGA